MIQGVSSITSPPCNRLGRRGTQHVQSTDIDQSHNIENPQPLTQSLPPQPAKIKDRVERIHPSSTGLVYSLF